MAESKLPGLVRPITRADLCADTLALDLADAAAVGEASGLAQQRRLMRAVISDPWKNGKHTAAPGSP